MPHSPLKASHYYNSDLTLGHSFGDIWRGLPIFGLLRHAEFSDGVVITPACDVAQYKTETLTYLPVMPLEDYFLAPAFTAECRGKILELYDQLDLNLTADWQKSGYMLPRSREIDAEIQKLLELRPRVAKKQDVVDSAIAGLVLIGNAITGDKLGRNGSLAAALFGKSWKSKINTIITNNFRSDIYFLPALTSESNQLTIWQHSVALLRYPITIPIEWLDEAQRCDISAWADYISAHPKRSVLLSAERMPIKIKNLNPQFRLALLSRYTALYARVGAPDFTTTAITKIAAELTK